MNRRSFIGFIFALPLVRHLKPLPRTNPFLPWVERPSPLIQDLPWKEENALIGHRVYADDLPRRFIGLRYTVKANPQFSGVPIRVAETVLR